MQNVQPWWRSPVALGAILTQLVAVAALFLTADGVNIIQVVGGAVIVIVGVVTSANNATNPTGWGAN
jgi:predicted lipoprotein